MAMTKIWMLSLAVFESQSQKPQNAKLEPEFSEYLGHVF